MAHATYQLSGPERYLLLFCQDSQEIQVHPSVRNEIVLFNVI